MEDLPLYRGAQRKAMPKLANCSGHSLGPLDHYDGISRRSVGREVGTNDGNMSL
jgi:hypothetical protein